MRARSREEHSFSAAAVEYFLPTGVCVALLNTHTGQLEAPPTTGDQDDDDDEDDDEEDDKDNDKDDDKDDKDDEDDEDGEDDEDD